MLKSASISPCGRYRYTLTREWNSGLPTMLLCGLNPSTADAADDDATIRKEIGFARRNECGSIMKVNLYALRATDWRVLRDALARGEDAIGPEYDREWFRAMRRARDRYCSVFVAAWGARIEDIPGGAERAKLILDCLRNRGAGGMPSFYRGHVRCFGRTKDGHPRHPVRIPYSTPMEVIW